MDDAPLVRRARPVRPAPRPARRRRRLGRHRHHLPRPRRRAALLQPVRQRAGATPQRLPRLPAGRRPRRRSRRSTCSATARPAWSGRRRCPATRGAPMRYVDLMGGQKPHLLVGVGNNLGAETRVALRAVDPVLPAPTRRAGRPVGHAAAVPGARRRAGRDATTASAATASSPATPTTTATSTASSASSAASAWSSSGTPRSSPRSPTAARRPATNVDAGVARAAGADPDLVPHRRAIVDGDARLAASSRGEYYREPGLTDAEAARRLLLADTVAAGRPDRRTRSARPAGRSRARCCARRSTRSTARAASRHPVHRHRAELHGPAAAAARRQPARRLPRPPARGGHLPLRARPGRPARQPRADARGRRLRQRAAAPPRSATAAGSRTRRSPPADQDRQARTLVTCTENALHQRGRRAPTTTGRRCRARRAPTSSTGLARRPARAASAFDAGARGASTAADADRRTRTTPAGGRSQKRLIEHVRTRYRRDDLGAAAGDPLALLPLGRLESRALPGRDATGWRSRRASSREAFGDRVDRRACSPPTAATSHGEGDAGWWMPLGPGLPLRRHRRRPGRRSWRTRAGTSSCRAASATRSHRAGFETEAVARATTPHDLLGRGETRDALGNVADRRCTTTACCSRGW